MVDASVTGLVFERDPQAHPVVDHLAVLDREILAEYFGDSQAADRPCGCLYSRPGRRLPRLVTHPDHLGDAIHAVGHSVSPVLVFRFGPADSASLSRYAALLTRRGATHSSKTLTHQVCVRSTSSFHEIVLWWRCCGSSKYRRAGASRPRGRRGPRIACG